jgi:hypothetical protein
VIGDVAGRADAIRERIRRAGGDPDRIRLIAVTKGFGVDVVRAALAAGLVDVGESYAQEMLEKVDRLEEEPSLRWHFVGRLQRNKVRKLAPFVTLWHSVDRLSLGAEIARWAPGARVLAQVDLSGEPTKGGCPPAMLPALVDGLMDLELDVRGLMGIGPLGAPEDARPGFRLLREMAEKQGLSELSMGMTADIEVAVEEGATMVRVGAGLFGPRPGASTVEH